MGWGSGLWKILSNPSGLICGFLLFMVVNSILQGLIQELVIKHFDAGIGHLFAKYSKMYMLVKDQVINEP